jgi:pyruvate,water dikinase
MDRKTYFDLWGHRGPHESELSIPRPAEDPDWLDQQLATLAQSPVEAEALLAQQQAEFEASWGRFQERYPGKVKSVRRGLDKAAQAARQRESIRSELVRLIGVTRVWALKAGELTGLGDQIFFLTTEEAIQLLSNEEALVDSIPVRQETYKNYKALPTYPVIIRGPFDPFQWAADPHRRGDFFDAYGDLSKFAANIRRENIISGVPGSAGVVEGTVRLLNSLEESTQLQPGEILVTVQTNVGWTPLFPLSRAIVTDVGAALSHAAIVARELGIPAVVNCGNATMRLKTGDRVRVDGIKGKVAIL